MRILFVATSRIPTERAMGTAIMKQCEGFRAAGHEVVLLLPRRRGALPDDPFRYHGVHHPFRITHLWCIEIPYFRSVGYYLRQLTFFISLVWYVTFESKDAILYGREPELLAFIPTAKRKFVELHHLYGLGRMGRYMLQQMDGIIALTALLAHDVSVRFGYPPKRTMVAPSGISLEAFEVHARKDQVRDVLGLPRDARIALYIGEFDAWKGVDTFLDASEYLHHRGILPVVIGGSVEVVEVKAKQYPHVRFLGRRPQTELHDNQQCADVLVIPNSGKYEISARHTSPLKVFSAMASGIPIVASRTSAMNEVLNDENAVLVPPDDADALGRALELVIQGGEEYQARADQARVDVTRYDWSVRTENILSFMGRTERELVKQGGEGGYIRFATFLIVGLFVALFQYLTFFVLFTFALQSALTASTISFILTVLVSYGMQKYITFRQESGVRKYGTLVGLMLLGMNALFGLFLNGVILIFGVQTFGFSPYAVQIFAMGVLATYNFFIYRLILT
jgi:glycosyltransferase involved in cell wall biosynthesis/putative flippase GtrA